MLQIDQELGKFICRLIGESDAIPSNDNDLEAGHH